jgi:outer membrane biosynthesis protein TonB
VLARDHVHTCLGEQLPETDSATTLMELYEKHLAPPPKKEKKGKKAKEDEEEDEAPKRKKRGQDEEEEPAAKKKSKKSKKKDDSDAEEEEEKEEEEKPKEKRSAKAKKGEEPAAAEEEEEEVEEKPKKGSKAGKNGNVPFQRIKSDEVTYLKVKGGQNEAERLLDNTFESKFADGQLREDYGAKASAILVAVRGKDFRHEKTKKKRGTYKGGPIDLASNSIKFVNSSDEDE